MHSTSHDQTAQLSAAPFAGWGSDALPRDYGDVRAEHEAIRCGVAIINLSPAGKLEVSGKNAVQFINGLVTNDIKSLSAGDGTLAAFLDVHGKVIALCRFYQTGQHLLIELDAAGRAKIFQSLSRFLPAGEFFLKDVTEQYALISLQGPRAAALIAALTGQPIAAAPEYHISEHTLGDHSALIAAHARCGETGFDLFVPAEAAPRVWQIILERGQPFGARAIGREALEIARIEAGVPREGSELSEKYILLETGCEQAISYTKGCYLGQEIIARIHWRGQPAKRLMGLLVEAPAAPPQGAELYSTDGKRIGEITSSTHSLALDRLIALGYVHRHYLTPGTELVLKSGESELGQAVVTHTPFIKSEQPPAGSHQPEQTES
jgi:folate-binding protein YgfZ